MSLPVRQPALGCSEQNELILFRARAGRGWASRCDYFVLVLCRMNTSSEEMFCSFEALNTSKYEASHFELRTTTGLLLEV